VIRWWGDPERELAVLAQDLDEPSMRQWIVVMVFRDQRNGPAA
jgi:hypothetical protein